MGWTIQHLDTDTRSDTQIANLMAYAERHLDAREMRGLDPIAARDGHNPLNLTPEQAEDVRYALDTLADRLGRRWNREARGWGKFAREIADAAATAARSGRPWRWN